MRPPFPLSASGTLLQNFGWNSCRQFFALPTTNHKATRRRLQSHLAGPSPQNAPHQPSLPFLLFFDTRLFPPSSKHCLHLLFGFFFLHAVCAKTLHLAHARPHLRVGQEEKDASQEGSQGGEDPP
jgi:hypothetical protein